VGLLEAQLQRLKAEEERIRAVEERLNLAKRVLPYLPYVQRLREIERDLRDRERILRDKLGIQGELKTVEVQIREAEREYARLPDLRKELQEALLEMDKLQHAEEELKALGKLKTELRRKESLLEKRRRELEKTEGRLKRGEALVAEVETRLLSLDYSEEEYIRTLREAEKLSSLKENLDHGERTLQEQSLSLYAHLIRKSLREGDSCPVCGNTYTGEPEAPQEHASLPELENTLIRLREEIASLEARRMDMDVRIENLYAEREEILNALREGEDLLSEEFARRFAELEEKRKRRRELEEKLERLRDAFFRLSKEREAMREGEN